MVKELKQKYINKEISQRQLITYIKNNIEYQDELKILYPFLESDDIIEYIYYLLYLENRYFAVFHQHTYNISFYIHYLI